MAAESKPEMRDEGATTLDATEMADMIRGNMGEPAEDTKSPRDAEPEIRAESDEPAVPSVERTDREESTSPEVVKALSTIAELQRKNEDLEARFAEVARRTVAQEPAIEYIEPFPNVRLPKDKDKWPIRLEPAQLEAIGIDPGITPGLNVLANAFFAYATRTIAEGVTMSMNTRQQVQGRVSNFRSWMETEHPDLRGMDDLLYTHETSMRAEGVHNRRLSDQDYGRELAKRARGTIAKMRGMTYDEYVSSIASGTPQAPTRSRASVSAGGRSPRRPASGIDKELEDMLS